MDFDRYDAEWGSTESPAPLAHEWPEPQPLTETVEAMPYPLEALPEQIRAAVLEVHGFVQAPLPMVATSALATLSLAGQSQVDVRRAERLEGPASLYLLTIADSGERKSTCDGFFSAPITEWERQQREEQKPVLEKYSAEIAAWEAKRKGILEAITQASKKGSDCRNLEATLRDHEADKPAKPVERRMTYTSATTESLTRELAEGWPSGGVLSSEAGIVFGGHSMNKESITRNLSTLNILWDGGTIKVDRVTSSSFTLRGSRLTVALQVQEATLRDFFAKSGDLARGTGFLARFLLSRPASTQGSRPFKEAPAHWPALEAYKRRIAALLANPLPLDETGRLAPPAAILGPEAKACWIAFHNSVESDLGEDGELKDIRDVASKIADNAARLAALFQLYEGNGYVITADNMARAARICAWHLHESRRFFGELATPEAESNAAKLDSWLIRHCRATGYIRRNEIQQRGPSKLRQRKALDDALRVLAECGRVRERTMGKSKLVEINPHLLGGYA